MDIDEYAVVATLGGIIDVSAMTGKEIVDLLKGLGDRSLLVFTYQQSSNVSGVYVISLYITTFADFSIKFKEHTRHFKKRHTYSLEVPSS